MRASLSAKTLAAGTLLISSVVKPAFYLSILDVNYLAVSLISVAFQLTIISVSTLMTKHLLMILLIEPLVSFQSSLSLQDDLKMNDV